MRKLFDYLLLASTMVLLVAMSKSLSAANLQISPVLINLRATQAAGGISLQNLGDRPIHGQVRVFAWEQRGGEDVLTPTDELVASPPIMEVGAKTSQTIRLVRRGGATPGPERAYRLLIDELPRGDEPGSGVAIRLQYSVPVFVAPADERAAPALAWNAVRRGDAWVLQLKNSGTLHAQVGAATLVDAAGKEIELSKGLLGYALAGSEREWRLPLAASAALAGPLTVRANINARPVSAQGSVASQGAAK